jgi:hypothetical protein
MNRFVVKLKLIFLPFIFIAVGTIGLYTFLNWLVLIKLDAFKINDIIINLFIPMVLPWIPLLIWLRPRIKLLKLKKGYKKDPVAGILFLNWVSIGFPLVIAQLYIATATGKLTRLDYMSQVNNLPATKYYTVEHFYSNKNMVHLKVAFDVSNKGNDFNMTIYGAVPVFDHIFPDTNVITTMRKNANAKVLVIINGILSNMRRLEKLSADSIRMMRYVNPSFVMPKYGDAGKYGALVVMTQGYKMKTEALPIKISPAAWFAVKYSEAISNRLSETEKQEHYKRFFTKSYNDFMHKPLDRFVYLSRLPYNKELDNYTAAIKSREDVMEGEPTILLPIYGLFADRNGNKLAWTFGLFGIGATLFLIILQFIPLRNIADIESYKPARKSRLKNFNGH